MNNILFLSASLAACLVASFGPTSQKSELASLSAGNACEFVSKSQAHGLMRALPNEAIGFIDCFSRHPEMNSIIVAKFATLDEKSLIDYVTKIGRKTDLTSRKSALGWESRQEIGSRQLIVKTISPAQEQRPEQVMAHYAFVAKAPAGGFLVFVHTASEAQTHRIRQTLMTVNHELENQALLRRMI